MSPRAWSPRCSDAAKRRKARTKASRARLSERSGAMLSSHYALCKYLHPFVAADVFASGFVSASTSVSVCLCKCCLCLHVVLCGTRLLCVTPRVLAGRASIVDAWLRAWGETMDCSLQPDVVWTFYVRRFEAIVQQYVALYCCYRLRSLVRVGSQFPCA